MLQTRPCAAVAARPCGGVGGGQMQGGAGAARGALCKQKSREAPLGGAGTRVRTHLEFAEDGERLLTVLW
eukprot:5914318-Prymnesium_polylepis.1